MTWQFHLSPLTATQFVPGCSQKTWKVAYSSQGPKTYKLQIVWCRPRRVTLLLRALWIDLRNLNAGKQE